MSLNLSSYLSKTFDMRVYNCWNFASDVWFDLTGKRLGASIEGYSASQLTYSATAKSTDMERLSAPVSPCLVLMQRRHLNPHIGVFYKGKILHLRELGASYVPPMIATMGYSDVSYYR